MKPPIRLDHCVIHVSDRARSDAFYRDVFGAELIAIADVHMYRIGATQLNVHGPGLDAHPVARPDRAAAFMVFGARRSSDASRAPLERRGPKTDNNPYAIALARGGGAQRPLRVCGRGFVRRARSSFILLRIKSDPVSTPMPDPGR